MAKAISVALANTINQPVSFPLPRAISAPVAILGIVALVTAGSLLLESCDKPQTQSPPPSGTSTDYPADSKQQKP